MGDSDYEMGSHENWDTEYPKSPSNQSSSDSEQFRGCHEDFDTVYKKSSSPDAELSSNPSEPQEADYLRAKLEQCKNYIRHLEKHCATLRSALLQIPEGEKNLAAVTKEIENDKNFECLHCKIEELTMMLFNFVAST